MATPEPTKAFFDQFPVHPVPDRSECPSEDILLEASRTKVGLNANTAAHIESCTLCSQIVQLLRASADQQHNHLIAFLDAANAQAERASAAHPVPLYQRLWATLWVSRTWQVAAGFMALIVCALALWTEYDRHASQPTTTLVSRFDSDGYRNTLKNLSVAEQQFSVHSVPDIAVVERVRSLNKELTAVHPESLPPERRAELATVVANLQKIITRTYGNRQDISITADSEDAGKVFMWQTTADERQDLLGSSSVVSIDNQTLVVRDTGEYSNVKQHFESLEPVIKHFAVKEGIAVTVFTPSLSMAVTSAGLTSFRSTSGFVRP